MKKNKIGGEAVVAQSFVEEKFKGKLMVVGGGSGGHVAAAKAVLEYMLEKKLIEREQIVYLVGSQGMIGERGVDSIEARMVAPLKIRTIKINGGKLHRFFTFDQVRQFLLLLRGFSDSMFVIAREKPQLLFSTGGFIAFPPVFWAWVFRIPVVIHEQTVVSGLSNRLAAPFATKICLSHENSAKYFTGKNVVVTGNPINKAVFERDIDRVSNMDPDFVRKFKEILEKSKGFPVVFLMGGAQGAHQLNEAFLAKLEVLLKKYSLILQVGENKVNQDYEKFLKKLDTLDKSKERVIILKRYGKEVGPILNSASVVVARGGANSLGEIKALGKRVLVVPLDGVSGDEQYENAKVLEDLGLAVIYREGDFSADVLLEGIDRVSKLDSAKGAERSPQYLAEANLSSEILSIL